MKKLLVVLMFMASTASAQQNIGNSSDLLSIPGMANAVSNAAKSVRPIGFVDFRGELGGGAFLPIRKLHDSAGINYAAAGIGGLKAASDNWRARGIFLFDSSAIWRRIENGSSWYSAHVEKTILPDFWIGPQILLPMPGDSITWKDYKRYLGFAVAVGL